MKLYEKSWIWGLTQKHTPKHNMVNRKQENGLFR